jgi:hypothetical protein
VRGGRRELVEIRDGAIIAATAKPEAAGINKKPEFVIRVALERNPTFWVYVTFVRI